MDALEHVPGRKATITMIVVIVAFGILSMLNQRGGPTSEVTGVVERFSFIPSEGAPPQVATVRLSDGAVVQAKVVSGLLIQPGQVARLRMYRGVFTGTPTYELIGIESRK